MVIRFYNLCKEVQNKTKIQFPNVNFVEQYIIYEYDYENEEDKIFGYFSIIPQNITTSQYFDSLRKTNLAMNFGDCTEELKEKKCKQIIDFTIKSNISRETLYTTFNIIALLCQENTEILWMEDRGRLLFYPIEVNISNFRNFVGFPSLSEYFTENICQNANK